MSMRRSSESDLTGLVLTGGRSTRFGDAATNKALTTLGTQSLYVTS